LELNKVPEYFHPLPPDFRYLAKQQPPPLNQSTSSPSATSSFCGFW
jgi:hypothetical protein